MYLFKLQSIFIQILKCILVEVSTAAKQRYLMDIIHLPEKLGYANFASKHQPLFRFREST